VRHRRRDGVVRVEVSAAAAGSTVVLEFGATAGFHVDSWRFLRDPEATNTPGLFRLHALTLMLQACGARIEANGPPGDDVIHLTCSRAGVYGQETA
jgi:hypothetical protein